MPPKINDGFTPQQRYVKRHPKRVRASKNRWRDKNYEKFMATSVRCMKERVFWQRFTVYLFKSTEPCMDCGKCYHSECMEFDHVRGKKKDNVSHLCHLSPERIQEEVDKCDLVCANCHRLRTLKRRLKCQN
jgi:hypothetical protein